MRIAARAGGPTRMAARAGVQGQRAWQRVQGCRGDVHVAVHLVVQMRT